MSTSFKPNASFQTPDEIYQNYYNYQKGAYLYTHDIWYYTIGAVAHRTEQTEDYIQQLVNEWVQNKKAWWMNETKGNFQITLNEDLPESF